MGGESSKSESNSLKIDSVVSNSANKNGILESMICKEENENTMIIRVWIVKKSITLNDRQVQAFSFLYWIGLGFKKDENIKLYKPKQNVFKLKNEYNSYFKHWAIILELSNDSYVNIQFGRNGFSLEEFNNTDIEGESILNAILGTWGEEGHPFSFCYLGNANKKYDELKEYLEKRKTIETESFKEKDVVYYNACFYNCQHFACDIEKFLFEEIKGWHSFEYYLDQFFKNFFPYIDMNKLKAKYENDLYKINEELFKLNVDEIVKKYAEVFDFSHDEQVSYLINKIEKLFSLKFEDYVT